MRELDITGNRSAVVGPATTLANHGVTLDGDASSVFDLGTGDDPGGNTIEGNDTSGETTGLVVDVDPATRVDAVGNFFTPDVQGADDGGEYSVGEGPCTATACDLSAGDGPNFRILSGTLRLAE